MMLDATKGPKQKELLEAELEAVGIRVNVDKPNIYFKVKKGGGIAYNATVKTSHLNEKLIIQILHDYKIHNAEVLVREDAVTFLNQISIIITIIFRLWINSLTWY